MKQIWKPQKYIIKEFPSEKEQWSEIKKRDSNEWFLTIFYVNTVIT
jgi:hypothetical protein